MTAFYIRNRELITKKIFYVLSVFVLISCSNNKTNDEGYKIESNEEYTKDVFNVSRSNYLEKLHGFWLGQSIANWTGLVTEMDKVGTKETMPFYTDDDWGKPDLKAIWGEYVPHSQMINFYFVYKGEPWGADDDTDIEYMYQYLFEKNHTSKLTAEQIRAGWLEHIYSEEDAPLFKKFPNTVAQKENFLWESNQQARILMEKGILPPLTSEPDNNKKYMMIDAQLTTEIFGLLAPARADVALQIANLPIRTSARNDAQWASEFYVIMHSLASVVDPSLSMQSQTLWLAQQARTHMPAVSSIAKMYDFVKDSFDNNPDKNDWEKTRDAVYQHYQLTEHDGYRYHDPFEAGINYVASLVSLFYGQGDIVRTVQIGTLVGWDSDNPTATWGGLLGFMLGKKGVEQAFKKDNLSETYWIHRTRRNFPDHIPEQEGEDRFSLMAERALGVIDNIVVQQMNGTIDSDNGRWLIPKK